MVTTLLVLKNRAYSKLAAAITAGATSLSVTAGEGANFPDTYPFHLTIDDEIVSCTNRSTDTLTIVRARQSTTAVAHSNKSYVALNITAKSVSDLNTAVNTIEDEYIHKDGSVAFTGTQEFHAPVIMTSSLDVAGATGFGAPVLMHSSLGVAGTTTLALAIIGGGLYVAGIANLPATIINSTLGVAAATTLTSATLSSTLGVTGAVTLGSSLALSDDKFITFGGVASLGWETADADANMLVIALPNGGAVDSPTIMIGDQSVLNFDLGTIIDLSALNEPNVVIVDADADSYFAFGYHSDDTPHIHTNQTFRLEVSGDTDDYFKFKTDTGVPTIFASGSYLRIGDVKFTQHSLDAEDDLMVSGDFEVSGVSFFDALVTISPIAAANSHLLISGTAKLNANEQAIYVNFPSETVATNAIWLTLGSTVASGDLTGIRSRVTGNADSSGANVRGAYLEAKVGAGKYAAMLEGALIHADYHLGNATISGDVRGLTVQISTGTNLTAANLYGILLNIQTRGSESGLSDDVGLMIRNEAVGGNGRTMDAAIKITDLNMGGGTNGFDVGISFAGITCTTAEIDLDFGKIIFDQDGDTDIHCDTEDELDIKIAGSNFLIMGVGYIRAGTTNEVSLGTSVKQFKNLYIDGVAYIDSFGETIYIGDTANAKMSLGMTINQGGYDNEILALKSSDVAHGATGIAETDTFGLIKKYKDVYGGLALWGLKESDDIGGGALELRGYLATDADTTKSTIGQALVEVYGSQTSGAGSNPVVANGNVFAVRCRSAAGSSTLLILNAEGDLWLSGGITTGGATVVDYIQNRFSGDFTSLGASVVAYKNEFVGALTGANGDTTLISATVLLNTITTQSNSQTIQIVSQAYLEEPSITKGTDTITVAATLCIGGAPDEGATNAAIYVVSGKILIASADPIQLGVTGSTTGTIDICGATSGVVTITVATTAGTWTMTLPAAVGTAGHQLTDAGGNGITSWAAAASLREYKDILCEANPQDALDAILNTKAYRFHYKEGFGTQDMATEYVGVLAEEAAWAMHYKGAVVNPVNTLGYMVLGFQAMDDRLETVEQKIGRLEGELAELKASLI